jgi:DNA-binding NtrC family response regulator
MKKGFTILIADRNSHVRSFLMRELMAEGHRVKLAASGENVLKIVFGGGDVDLLVLDPDLPGVDATAILKDLTDRIPPLPMVLHTHRRLDETKVIADGRWCAIIEKAGDSVEHIKAAVERLLSSAERGIGDMRWPMNREGPQE